MKIKLIAAVGKKGELGKVDLQNGFYQLPNWNLPGDMKKVKDLTFGNYVLMGRRTYESLPEKVRPLPDRINIVFTSDRNYKVPEGVRVMHNENEFMNFISTPRQARGQDLWIFGGAEIYKNFMKYADEMYITEVNGEFPECNVFFPELNFSDWELVSKEKGNQEIEGEIKKTQSHEFYHCVYRKSSLKGRT